MGSSVNFPVGRDDSSTTLSVADLIARLALPVIEPLGTDIAAMSALPPLPFPGAADPSDADSATSHDGTSSPRPTPRAAAPRRETVECTGTADASPEDSDATAWPPQKQAKSQLEAARMLMDECIEAVAALHKHQNQCTALAAVLIDRLQASTRLEATVLTLDSWQHQPHMAGVRAELAGILNIPENIADRLMDLASTLVHDVPATLAALADGWLGWDHAAIIADEATLLRQAGLPIETIESFERALLEKAVASTLPSFREKARRLRERSYPESIPVRTRRSFASRSLRVGHGQDGMSWLSLYLPAPTVEGIWDQCTLTAQAAQGPHEDRTLTQLRADVAAALLLNQSMAQNHLYSPTFSNPAAGTSGPSTSPPPPLVSDHRGTGTTGTEPSGTERSRTEFSAPDKAETSLTGAATPLPEQSTSCNGSTASSGFVGNGLARRMARYADLARVRNDPRNLFQGPEPLPSHDGPVPDPDQGWYRLSAEEIPVFDDPNYRDPGYRDPDIRNDPDWHPAARPPVLSPAPSSTGMNVSESGRTDAVWPPMPQVTPVLLIPVLSMLGATNEPAWMEGSGPISMEVAQYLMTESSSFYRVLVDPITNRQLDCSPQRYRVTKAMRTMLRIRDEYCQFPGCTAKASTSDVDHITKFESGGPTIFSNLQALCKRHHRIKHFKDDKTRDGQYRTDQSPERSAVRLRGWTPVMTDNGVAWTSPSGRYYPPKLADSQAPVYTKWLRRYIDHSLRIQYLTDDLYCGDIDESGHPDRDQEEQWNDDIIPEPPAGTFPSDEDEEILTHIAIENYLLEHASSEPRED